MKKAKELNRGIMTITLINSVEKWLLDLYGEEYTKNKSRVNRCIPWKSKGEKND